MFTFWGLLTAITMVGGTPIVAGLWWWHRSRSLRRNRHGECAACGSAWPATGSPELYLIQGRLVCEDCAATARRRMPWHFAVLAGAAAAATALAVLGSSSPALVLLPVGSTVVMTLGAVHAMKRANRNAQRRIASGRYPALHSF